MAIKAIFEDVAHNIDILEGEDAIEDSYKCRGCFGFKEAYEILLTESQIEKFVGNERNRIFTVSKKRLDAFKAYMNGEGNIWRK